LNDENREIKFIRITSKKAKAVNHKIWQWLRFWYSSWILSKIEAKIGVVVI
jgi:hypothetical protein